MNVQYWNREVETISKENLKELQLLNLKETIFWALKTPFYKNRLNKNGIYSQHDIKTPEDIKKIPFTTKEDLRNAYPYGLLSVNRDEVVRLHASSGTTGTPTVIYHTREDIDNWTDLAARSIVCAGGSKKDVFQNIMSYGLFTGGLGLHYGAEKLGMLVIPAGSGNTKRQFKLMKDFQSSILHVTPGYLLHLYSKMEEENLSLKELSLKKALVGAEPHTEDIRKKIEYLFNIDVYNSYGLSEMNGPGVAFECEYKSGMHLWEDSYILELINPDSLEVLKDGEQGELVLTTLKRKATPLLRYRTRDLTFIYPEPCRCGRTHRRIARIKGRTDDMLIINGVNVFPSQIEEVIMKYREVGTNYLIVVEKTGALDKLTVKIEVNRNILTDDTRDLYTLKHRIREDMKASILINPVIEMHEHGVLPVSEGKAVRVSDIR